MRFGAPGLPNTPNPSARGLTGTRCVGRPMISHSAVSSASSIVTYKSPTRTRFVFADLCRSLTISRNSGDPKNSFARALREPIGFQAYARAVQIDDEICWQRTLLRSTSPRGLPRASLALATTHAVPGLAIRATFLRVAMAHLVARRWTITAVSATESPGSRPPSPYKPRWQSDREGSVQMLAATRRFPARPRRRSPRGVHRERRRSRSPVRVKSTAIG